ncbi:MAG TPA: hypothetical protein VNH18_33290 [Bryobacteraceae bacterium]|nr:hypothetical protein [Bryobacteraceae bacterium]
MISVTGRGTEHCLPPGAAARGEQSPMGALKTIRAAGSNRGPNAPASPVSIITFNVASPAFFSRPRVVVVLLPSRAFGTPAEIALGKFPSFANVETAEIG